MNKASPLTSDLRGWWTPLPGFFGGFKLHNLVTWPTATLDQGWHGDMHNQPGYRLGGCTGSYGAIAFIQGISTSVSLNVSSTPVTGATFAFMMNITSSNGWPLTFGGGFAQGFLATGSSIRFRGWGIDQTAGGLSLANTWKHITASIDGSNVRLYIDGILTATWGTGTGSQTVDNLVLGHRGDFNEFFGGGISDAMFYTKALPQNMIMEVYLDCKSYHNKMLSKLTRRSLDNTASTQLSQPAKILQYL
jgi:hypothetical protein